MSSSEEPLNKKSSSQNLELLSRLDERVKNLHTTQSKIEDQIARMSKSQTSLFNKTSAIFADLELHQSRIKNLENEDFEEIRNSINQINSKIQSMDVRVGNNDSRWFLLFDSVWKIVLMLIASYILYKLGWQPPTVP